MSRFTKTQASRVVCLVVVLCGTGTAIGLGQDGMGRDQGLPPPPRENAEKGQGGQSNRDELDRAGLKMRVTIAQLGYEETLAELSPSVRQDNGAIQLLKVREAFEWSLRLLEAERDVGHSKAERHDAQFAYIQRTSDMKDKLIALFPNRRPKLIFLEVEWHLFNAENWLMEERRK